MFTKLLLKQKNLVYKSIIIIFIYSIIYFFIDFREENDEKNETSMFIYNKLKNDTILRKYFNKLYFSFVTYTNLGLGDISPIHPLTQFLVVTQAFVTIILFAEIVI